MWKIGDRIKQLVLMGRSGTEAFVEMHDEQVRQKAFEYERMRFIEDIHCKYPRLLEKYSESDLIKFWEEVRPRLTLS